MTTATKKQTLTQRQTIQSHLEIRGSITAQEALFLYRIFRLAARVEELRRDGMEIETEMKTDLLGKRYAYYTI